MKHVDVVQNDVAAGRQRCLGRVTSLADLGVKVEVDDGNLERTLNGGVLDPGTGIKVLPHDHGDRYLAALQRAWQGSLLMVTNEHDDDACPFSAVTEVDMPILSARQSGPDSERD